MRPVRRNLTLKEKEVSKHGQNQHTKSALVRPLNQSRQARMRLHSFYAVGTPIAAISRYMQDADMVKPNLRYKKSRNYRLTE